jgi:hypothetical protein
MWRLQRGEHPFVGFQQVPTRERGDHLSAVPPAESQLHLRRNYSTPALTRVRDHYYRPDSLPASQMRTRRELELQPWDEGRVIFYKGVIEFCEQQAEFRQLLDTLEIGDTALNAEVTLIQQPNPESSRPQ